MLEGREILGGIETGQDEPLARGELELAEYALDAQLEAHLLVEGTEEVPHGDLIPAFTGRRQDDLRGRDVGQGVRLRIALASHETESGYRFRGCAADDLKRQLLEFGLEFGLGDTAPLDQDMSEGSDLVSTLGEKGQGSFILGDPLTVDQPHPEHLALDVGSSRPDFSIDEENLTASILRADDQGPRRLIGRKVRHPGRQGLSKGGRLFVDNHG